MTAADRIPVNPVEDMRLRPDTALDQYRAMEPWWWAVLIAIAVVPFVIAVVVITTTNQ